MTITVPNIKHFNRLNLADRCLELYKYKYKMCADYYTQINIGQGEGALYILWVYATLIFKKMLVNFEY